MRIERVVFSGATELLDAAWLDSFADEAAGRGYDFAGLQTLAARVTAELARRGWMLARAVLPQQDLAGGRLEIVVRAGRIDPAADGAPLALAVGPRGLRLDAARLQALLGARLDPGAPLARADLERGLLLANDLPGVSARARLEPGSTADTTRITVDVDEGPRLGATAWLDNHGSPDTGRAQAGALVALDDALGRGEQFGAQFTRSAGLWLARVSAGAPLGFDGTRVNAGASALGARRRGAVGRAAGLEGGSQTLQAGVTHPLVRSRERNVSIALGAGRKRLHDDATAGNLRDKRQRLRRARRRLR